MQPSPHAWIDPQNSFQLGWIATYLHRHQGIFLPRTDVNCYPPVPTYSDLINAIDAHMGNPLFRERYRKMQAAWRQAKSRQDPSRRMVSYHMSNEALGYLNKLAEERGEAKIHLLEQMIRDRRHEHDRGAKEIKKNKKIYQARLKDQRSKYLQAEQVNRNIINGLLDALAESLHANSRLEAQVGGADDAVNEPLDQDTHNLYQTLLDEKVAHVNASITDLKTQRLPGGSLQQRIDKLTPVS